jgi:hypothetical protein
MAIFIVWEEETAEFVEWKYVGGGEYDPIYKQVTITKKARWSNENTKAQREAAQKYIHTEMQDKPTAKVVVLED